MTVLPAVSAVVLAGGRSRRFGRDKLAELIGDRPLLDLAIDAATSISGDVIVVAAPGATPSVPAGVRVVHDVEPFEGPLAGCLTGLEAAREPLVLLVGGDMPSLRTPVLELLIRTLDSSAADACVIEHLGRRQPLPMAIRTGSGTELVRRLVHERERRLGALLDRVLVRALAEAEWRPLDPDALTLRDVDEEDDLRGLDDDAG